MHFFLGVLRVNQGNETNSTLLPEVLYCLSFALKGDNAVIIHTNKNDKMHLYIYRISLHALVDTSFIT